MATRFQVKRSSVSGVKPTTTDIQPGELAVNINDRILFSANATTVFEVGSNLSSIAVGNSSVKFTVNATHIAVPNAMALVANGSNGTSGQVLHSNGTGIYWATDDQGVTSVATGNGLTGGTITTTGTISVIANNGITANATGVYVTQGTGVVVNSTGVHVNSTYIGTLTANNSNNLNGQPASYYTNATNISTGTLATARLPATANISTAINVGSDVNLTTTSISVGNSTVNSSVNATVVAATGNVVSNSFVISGSNDYITSTTSVDGWFYSNLFSVSAQDIEPRDVYFSTDGTKMYVLGNAGNDVGQYNLGTAWHVNTAVYSNAFVVTTQEGNPYGLTFKPDGTAFYICGSNDIVYQYSLSSAWDITTASYTSKSFSVTAKETDPQALEFSSDGTKMYVTGSISDSVHQYDLGTAWDVTTAVFTTTFSVATYDTAPQGIAFNSTGTKMWVLGSGYSRLMEYALATPWALSTATFTQFGVVSNLGTNLVLGASGIYVNETQGKAYISDYQNDAIFQLTTDIKSSKFIGTKFVFQPDALFQNDLVVDKNGRFNGELRVLGAATTLSLATSVLVASGAVTFNTAVGALNIGTSLTTGTLVVGGTAQTGNTQIGRSTGNHTLAIANGATTSGNTKIVEIGTAGLAGSNTTINIGSSLGTGTITLNQQTSISGNVGIGTASPSVKLDVNSTDGIRIPIGNTAQRPTTSNGMIRYNTDTGFVEAVANSTWTNLVSSYSSVRQQFTASSNQTSFTITGGYTPGQIDVYRNGVKMVPGTDANVSSGTAVVLTAPAANNDTVEVVGFTTVTITDVVKKSGDTMTGNLVVSGTISDSIGNVRDVPINSQTVSYQIATTDAGKTISSNAGITVNGAILYAGFMVSIFNNSAANITITSGANTTMYLAGTATTGNRTLTQRGFATVQCVAANTFVITGAGVT